MSRYITVSAVNPSCVAALAPCLFEPGCCFALSCCETLHVLLMHGQIIFNGKLPIKLGWALTASHLKTVNALQILHALHQALSHELFTTAERHTRIIVLLVGLLGSLRISDLGLQVVLVLLLVLVHAIPEGPLSVSVNVHLHNSGLNGVTDILQGGTRATMEDERHWLVALASQLLLDVFPGCCAGSLASGSRCQGHRLRGRCRKQRPRWSCHWARKKAPHRPAKPPQAECTDERSPHRCCPHHPPHHQSHQAPSPTKGWSWPCAPSTSCKWRCCPPKIPLTGPTCGKRREAHRSSQSTPRWPQWGHRTMATKTSGSGRCEGSPAHRRAWPLGAHEVLQPRCLQCRQHHRCCQRPCPPRTDHHHGRRWPSQGRQPSWLLPCKHSLSWSSQRWRQGWRTRSPLRSWASQPRPGQSQLLASRKQASWWRPSLPRQWPGAPPGNGVLCAFRPVRPTQLPHRQHPRSKHLQQQRTTLWLLTQVAHLLLVHLWARGRGQECLGSRIGTDTGNCHGASFGRHDAQRRTSNPDWMLLSTKILAKASIANLWHHLPNLTSYVLRGEQLAARFSEYPHPIATIASEQQLIVSTFSFTTSSSCTKSVHTKAPTMSRHGKKLKGRAYHLPSCTYWIS